LSSDIDFGLKTQGGRKVSYKHNELYIFKVLHFSINSEYLTLRDENNTVDIEIISEYKGKEDTFNVLFKKGTGKSKEHHKAVIYCISKENSGYNKIKKS
jgi:hypothetical protein